MAECESLNRFLHDNQPLSNDKFRELKREDKDFPKFDGDRTVDSNGNFNKGDEKLFAITNEGVLNDGFNWMTDDEFTVLYRANIIPKPKDRQSVPEEQLIKEKFDSSYNDDPNWYDRKNNCRQACNEYDLNKAVPKCNIKKEENKEKQEEKQEGKQEEYQKDYSSPKSLAELEKSLGLLTSDKNMTVIVKYQHKNMKEVRKYKFH